MTKHILMVVWLLLVAALFRYVQYGASMMVADVIGVWVCSCILYALIAYFFGIPVSNFFKRTLK